MAPPGRLRRSLRQRLQLARGRAADRRDGGGDPDGRLRILALHTADPERCFFALTTIHGGVEAAFPGAGLLHLPGRDFVVFAGPLAAAGQVGYEDGAFEALGIWPDGRRERILHPARWRDQPPNLIWPEDHSWFAQSEYDLDSTLVGGSRALADDLLASPDLETWEVERGDSLEASADKIN